MRERRLFVVQIRVSEHPVRISEAYGFVVVLKQVRMCQQVSFALVLGVVLALVQNGYALQCWKCNSQYDVTCRDYFNVTKIELNRRYYDNSNYGNRQIQPSRTDPHMETCDERNALNYNQKNVCLKQVLKGAHDIPIVIRECRLVPSVLKQGECPEELKANSRNMEFCGTCETHGCNSAPGVYTAGSRLLASAVPVMFILFLRY